MVGEVVSVPDVCKVMLKLQVAVRFVPASKAVQLTAVVPPLNDDPGGGVQVRVTISFWPVTAGRV